MDKDVVISTLRIFVISFVLSCLVFFTAFGIGKLWDRIEKENQFEYAYVLVGEEWQNFELKNWTNQSRTHYKLYIKDGTVMVVLKANTILYNGELPAEVRQ